MIRKRLEVQINFMLESRTLWNVSRGKNHALKLYKSMQLMLSPRINLGMGPKGGEDSMSLSPSRREVERGMAAT